jgi:hypothetical protein
MIMNTLDPLEAIHTQYKSVITDEQIAFSS